MVVIAREKKPVPTTNANHQLAGTYIYNIREILSPGSLSHTAIVDHYSNCTASVSSRGRSPPSPSPPPPHRIYDLKKEEDNQIPFPTSQEVKNKRKENQTHSLHTSPPSPSFRSPTPRHGLRGHPSHDIAPVPLSFRPACPPALHKTTDIPGPGT